MYMYICTYQLCVCYTWDCLELSGKAANLVLATVCCGWGGGGYLLSSVDGSVYDWQKVGVSEFYHISTWRMVQELTN